MKSDCAPENLCRPSDHEASKEYAENEKTKTSCT